MALMNGFPPLPDAQVTLANWRTFPYVKWSFQHVREIVPSADIVNDPANVATLEASPLPIGDIPFRDIDGATRNISEFLDRTDTDAFVVLHRGKLLAERYANGMTATTPHILMSVSKSLLGLLAGVLSEDGTLDVQKPASFYVPELKGSAYEHAVIRDLLDMRAGVEFDEDYVNHPALMIQYRKAMNWHPSEPGEQPSDLRAFLSRLRPRSAYQGQFDYLSPNTDLLAWVIERASDRRYADLLSERLWQRIGAAANAYITVDRLGAPRAAGGVCTTARDLALVGAMVAGNGSVDGRQVVPENWIRDILNGGDTQAWNAGSFTELYPQTPMHYRSKWYVETAADGYAFALGVHGQNLFVAPDLGLVIVKLSSQPQALDVAMIRSTTLATRAIHNYVKASPPHFPMES